ncbi:MAG TPA: DUF1616 domain-containing protein [Thermoplasmata archaeon]|nr:DUF1616 domain-containing protein [Thermoplasmata archaeon]
MTELWQAAVGLMLIYFLPGFAVTRALFPERRVFRPTSAKVLVEQLTSSVILSVAITILAGYVWLGTSVGVQVTWAQPRVEESLAVISGVTLAVAAARGSFARRAPKGPDLAPESGHSDPMAIIRQLDELGRRRRSLEHQRRVTGADSPDSVSIDEAIRQIDDEDRALRAQREAEYASH